MARTPEGKVKDAIKAYLRSLGDECWWFMPIGGAYSKQGVPDFIICYKGVFIAVEAKRPGAEGAGLTRLQQLQITAITAARGFALVASSVEPVRGLIEALDQHVSAG